MLNKVELIGRIGQDPEIKYMPNGDQVVTLNVATTRRWKDRNTNELKKETEWHRVTFFNALAKVAGDYLKKGSLAHIQGRIKTTKYQKDGQDVYATGIIGEELLMLDQKKDGSNEHHQAAQTNQQSTKTPQSTDDFDDDIPF